MSISIKWNHRGSFRRFGLPVPANGDLYGALMAKILAVQPDFNESIAWKDAEGDMIVFSSTTELSEAINSIKNDEPLRVYTVNDAEKQTNTTNTTTENKETEAGNNVDHPNVMCDSCDGAVRGIRYKCMSCADFDLCSSCEKEGKHAQHPMARIADPNDRSWMAHHHMFMRKMCKGMRHQQPWGPGRGAHHWFRQQMRQQQEGQQQNADGTGPSAFQPGQQPAELFSNGMDFLREVGVTVAEALTNLGINVDVDVEHDGAREKVAEPTNKTTANAQNEQPKETTQDQPTAPQQPVAESLEHQMEQAHIDSPNGHDWTMVEGAEAAAAPPQPTNQNNGQQSLYPDMSETVHHPDPRINQTLNALLSMGFDNQDSWLQQLVEAKRGDINAVLNALQPRH